MSSYRWRDRFAEGSTLGLAGTLAIVHDGWLYGESTRTNGRVTQAAATFPANRVQRYSTGSGIFQFSSETSNTAGVIYKSADGLQAYTEVLRYTNSYAGAYTTGIIDCDNGRLIHAEYGDEDPGSRLYYSADGGDTWTELFRSAANAIRHFHGGKWDPLTHTLYLFSGDSGAKSSIMFCDDLADLVDNPATWRTRWGLDDATRSTLDTDYVVGYDAMVYRNIDAGFDGDWMYFGADTLGSGGQDVARAHRVTHEVQTVPVHSLSAKATDGKAVGEVWAWGHSANGVLLMAGSAADDSDAGADGWMHVYALEPGGSAMYEIWRVQRTIEDGGVAIPHRIDVLGDYTIISPRLRLPAAIGEVETRRMVHTYPRYDDNEVATWYYGMHSASGNSGALASLVTAAYARWMTRTMRLSLQPGRYLLTSIIATLANTTAAVCDGAVFQVFRATDTTQAQAVTLGNGLTFFDITAAIIDQATSYTITPDLGGVTLDIEAGYTYYFGLSLHAPAGTPTGQPSMRRMTDPQGPLGQYFTGPSTGVPGALNSPPSALTTYQDGSTGTQARMTLKFQTAVRKVFEIAADAYSAAAEHVIPVCSDADYHIMLGDVVVADGQALTVQLDYDNNGVEAARTTLVHDFGATDQSTFGAVNVALTGQAGDAFDLDVNMRPVAGKADLFVKNTEAGQGDQGAADIQTKSHWVTANASRTNPGYTVGAPRWLDMSGTATVGRIAVCREPLVILGDANGIDLSDRLGGNLPDAFTFPRGAWVDSIEGNLLTADSAGSHTAAASRYKHATPGKGDLCEFTGAVLVIAIGTEDIKLIGTTEANRNKVVPTILAHVAEILAEAADKGNATLLIGLPPYSIAGSASEQEARAIAEQLNAGLEGLAVACRSAYVNPWHAMVDGGTSGNPVPTFAASYTSDGGQRYATAGAVIVATAAARAFEAAIAGGWWHAPARRISRRMGSLWPI